MPTTPLQLYTATVLARRLVTPGMVRVTIGGDGLKGVTTTGVGDEYVRLFFPDPETGELVTPEVDERGFWRYPEGKKPAHCECYTIRAARPGEFDLDFVIHDHGRASEWAQRANLGDTIVIREPYGIYEAPPDTDWHLFVCDATGLPALGRLLENLPAGSEARAIVEVPDASHEQPLTSPATLRIVWLHAAGNGITQSRLPEAVRGVSFPTGRKPYVWAAGEVKAVRAIRKFLRHELKWEAARYSITGYWTEKAAEWTAGWEALDPAIKTRLDDLWASDRDREEVADEYDATLEKFGL